MKGILLAVLLVLCMASVASGLEIVMANEDIEVRFPATVDPLDPTEGWISGGDLLQTVFSVIGSITYSADPLSSQLTHTTKLGEPETWEAPLWGHDLDPFKKAIFILVIHEAPDKVFEVRVRNRYLGEESNDLWSLSSDPDKIIGKPGKPGHVK